MESGKAGVARNCVVFSSLSVLWEPVPFRIPHSKGSDGKEFGFVGETHLAEGQQ